VAERNRIRTTLRYLQSGILSLDAESCIVSSNPAVEAITGLTRDQARTFGDLIRAVTADARDREHVHDTLERCLVTGSTAHIPELHIQRQPDGRPRTLHLVASPVLDEGTTGISLVIALNDVTETWEMARRVSRTERLAAIGEMAASVAHEIKNPLTGIGAALDVLLAEDSDPEFQVLKREIRNQLRRLNELVTDLMNFAKPVSIHPEQVIFDDLVHASMQALRHHPAMARVEVIVEGGAAILNVDPLQFPHVLQNLVLNAAQATGRNGRVILRAIPVPGGTEVSVQDEGQGLSEALLNRIFKPFFTTKAQGTGLGLSLCRKIVEAHGGTIEARNAPEGGAVFVTRLPLPLDVATRKLEPA
jgi:PAS domain S-box-containing protein